VIFDMNSRADKPGYGMMLARGTTSLPEAWDANPDSSLNHFMLGHIMEWFYADLAGIRRDPALPAWKSIVIRPQPVGDIQWVEAEYRSPYGPISSQWRRAGGRLTLKVSVPPNTSATVCVPAETGELVTEGGKPAAQSAGVRRLRREPGAQVFHIDSGDYTFVVRR
jgi:hypothetical protein